MERRTLLFDSTDFSSLWRERFHSSPMDEQHLLTDIYPRIGEEKE